MPAAPAPTVAMAEALEWMRAGTARFEALLDELPDEEFDRPSLLPGWNRAHVVAHVAGNADALGNLVSWAATGVERPMYASREQRTAAIAAGARQPPDRLRAAARESAVRLAAAIDELPAPAWHATVRSALGRTIPAGEIPWMRSREVWVHGVDLGSGGSFAELPAAMARALLTEASTILGRQPGCPAVELAADDRELTGRLGDPAATGAVTVRGPSAALLKWVLGRGVAPGDLAATGGPLPTLPRWL